MPATPPRARLDQRVPQLLRPPPTCTSGQLDEPLDVDLPRRRPPAQLQEALDLLLQRAPPERRAVAHRRAAPPAAARPGGSAAPPPCTRGAAGGRAARNSSRGMSLDHQPHDLPFDPARHRLDQAADVRVDFGRRQIPGPAGAVATVTPSPAVSPAVPPPGWEGGAAGPPHPHPPPGRRGREEGPGTTSALAENLGRSTTGRVGTGWNVTRRVSVSKVRNPLSLCDLLPHVRRRALDAARVPHVRRQLGRDVVVAQARRSPNAPAGSPPSRSSRRRTR